MVNTKSESRIKKSSSTPLKSSHPATSTRSTGSGSKTMAELLAAKKPAMASLNRGDTVEGTITKLSSQEVLLDINAKTDALVLEKDKRLLKTMLATLKVGDKVKASVLSPEGDLGYPIVSLRRFMGDTSWTHLETLQKEQKPVVATITESTRGGFLVTTLEGAAGFLPNSHAMIPSGEEGNMIGKKIDVYVLELQRASNKIIFSQKKILDASDFSKAIKGLKVGEKVAVMVTNTASFGVFVALSVGDVKLDGLIHISEISWEKVTDVSGMFEVGQNLWAMIIGFDRDNKRVDLSLKRLTVDPFEKIAEKYPVDSQVSGTVSAVLESGVEVTLEDSSADSGQVVGMIRKEKIPPTVSFEVGDGVKATVALVDKKRQRIMLVPVLAAKPLGYR